MLTLTITDEKLQAAFDNHLNSLLTTGNYDNPVKRAMDELIGYSSKSEVKDEFNKQVKEFMLTAMKTPEFAAALGAAMAAEIAKREVDKLKR